MNVEALREAQRVLRGLSEQTIKEHFDMGSWGRKTPCGTTACAVGHCAMDDWFVSRGFHTELGLGEPYKSLKIIYYLDSNPNSCFNIHVKWGWEAVQYMFKIDEKTAESLFLRPTSAEAVIEAIEKLLES